ncbi:MNNG and nitrosoguanidine resistance protein [Xylaria sp. FL0933]|nr:MNNG and nitrosoguanidine resistance protein [Xylaria sp. FL0933]
MPSYTSRPPVAPSRYRRKQSFQSYQSSYSKASQGLNDNPRNIVSPYEYGPVNEHNLLDYNHVPDDQSVGFWHPKMKEKRKHVFILWIRTKVHVVDFDSQVAPYNKVEALVGPVITNLTRRIHSSSLHESLGYRIVAPSGYQYSPMAVRRAVYDWDAWAAVIINPNAISALLHAVLNGDSSYDPTRALQILMSQFVTQFGAAWSKMLLTNSSFSSLVMAEASAAVSPGIVPLKIDIRPFEPSTATPAVTMGRFYLIVVSFFSFSLLLPIHNQVNFLGMVALGLASENVVMVLGQRWAPLWLIFWMITNISTAFYTMELAPAFFRWGRGWPLQHVVQASRQIIFDLKSEIVLNFGVLMAWAVINTALFPICCDFMRWRTRKQQKEALKANSNQYPARRPAITEQGFPKNGVMNKRGRKENLGK